MYVCMHLYSIGGDIYVHIHTSIFSIFVIGDKIGGDIEDQTNGRDLGDKCVHCHIYHWGHIYIYIKRSSISDDICVAVYNTVYWWGHVCFFVNVGLSVCLHPSSVGGYLEDSYIYIYVPTDRRQVCTFISMFLPYFLSSASSSVFFPLAKDRLDRCIHLHLFTIDRRWMYTCIQLLV